MKRIFISIPLPGEVREKILETIERWRWLPIRWIPPQNWHVTIIPPFPADEGDLAALPEAVGEHLKDFFLFSLKFEAVSLAPPGRNARMIWLTGPFSLPLQKLVDAYGRMLAAEFKIRMRGGDSRQFLPHITLARFAEGDLRDLEVKTHILEDVPLSFNVKEVCVVEARSSLTTVEYETAFCISFTDIRTRSQ